jgi:hypothetical protein
VIAALFKMPASAGIFMRGSSGFQGGAANRVRSHRGEKRDGHGLAVTGESSRFAFCSGGSTMFTGLLGSLMSSLLPILVQLLIAAMFGGTGTTN